MAIRVTSVVAQAVATVESNIRLTQLGVNVLSVPVNPGVRVTQLVVEVLTTALPPPSPTTVEYVQPTFRGTNRGIARGII